MDVNAELYEFLKDNETGMFLKDGEVVAYVHIRFYNLNEFVEIVGEGCFDEGGMEVKLFADTVCVELNDIIEGEGHDIISYKKCFEESDITRYRKELESMVS